MRHISVVQSFKASDGKLCGTIDELVQHEFKLILQKHWMDADPSLAAAVYNCFDELHEIWHARERFIKGTQPPSDRASDDVAF